MTTTTVPAIEDAQPWINAMWAQQTVWARARNGIGEISEDWFEAVVTEIRRPSPHNVEHGLIAVRRRHDDQGVTYVYPLRSDCLSLTPRAPGDD